VIGVEDYKTMLAAVDDEGLLIILLRALLFFAEDAAILAGFVAALDVSVAPGGEEVIHGWNCTALC
jgi:hypothetical protein